MKDNIRTCISPFTKRFKREEERIVDIWLYNTCTVGSFSFYIPKLESLTSRFDLDLLIHYRIFLTLNPTFYYTNCFIYALEHYGVPSDKIDVIRSYLVSIYLKIKDIGYLGKLLKLCMFVLVFIFDHEKK